jgi:hypothetical protein
MFSIQTIEASDPIAYPHFRFDIDYPHDLDRLVAIANEVGIQGSAYDFICYMKNRSGDDVYGKS